MCGRYSILTEDEIIEIRSILHDISLRIVKDDLEGCEVFQNEIRPTNNAPIIAMTDQGVSFESAKFGFKKWDGKGVIINARTETLQKPGNMFSGIKNMGRCVVPAGEYYEWKAPKTEIGSKASIKKNKIKHFIKDKEGNLLFFAGLYQDTPKGREFLIITREAQNEIANIHDRMPVILLVSQLESWLKGTLSFEEITKTDFNIYAAPCEETNENTDNSSEQISLF